MSGLNSRSLFLIIIGDISRNIVQYEKQCDDTDDGRVEFKKIVTSFVRDRFFCDFELNFE